MDDRFRGAKAVQRNIPCFCDTRLLTATVCAPQKLLKKNKLTACIHANITHMFKFRKKYLVCKRCTSGRNIRNNKNIKNVGVQ